MSLTAFAPRRARPAVEVPYLWWGPRMADKDASLEVSSLVAGAHRDVHLVLGDDRPLPALQADVDQLLVSFAVHLESLLRIVDVRAETTSRIARMQLLGRLPRPLGHMESRIRLVMAAECVQDVLAHLRPEGAPRARPEPRRWRWRLLARRLSRPAVNSRWARDREEAHV